MRCLQKKQENGTINLHQFLNAGMPEQADGVAVCLHFALTRSQSNHWPLQICHDVSVGYVLGHVVYAYPHLLVTSAT